MAGAETLSTIRSSSFSTDEATSACRFVRRINRLESRRGRANPASQFVSRIASSLEEHQRRADHIVPMPHGDHQVTKNPTQDPSRRTPDKSGTPSQTGWAWSVFAVKFQTKYGKISLSIHSWKFIARRSSANIKDNEQ
jgi:hypothetical protein